MDWRPDAIVIGAGVAGLAAAGILTRAGRSVEILEARNRIGGRIHTLHDPLWPVPVELGAEFIHGKPPEIWSLVDSGHLPALEVDADDWFVRAGRPERPGELFERIEPLMRALADAPEQSFEQFVQNSGADPDLRRWATSYVEGFNAARRERISVKWLAQGNEASAKIEGDRAFRPAHGYDSLVDLLWAAIDPRHARAHLQTVAHTIRWSRGRVEIAARAFGSERVFHAPRAIVTVPLGVLQAAPGSEGAIHFDPEPGTLRAAREGIVMGNAMRITLRFRRPVWERRSEFRNLGFLFSAEQWMPTWWTALPVHAPVITGWTGGTLVEDVTPADRANPLAGALRTLSRLLGMDQASLTAELQSYHTHDWRADPFSRGSYTYVQVGGLEAQQRFGDPLEETLYFAGEAVDAEGHASTIHGAIASGERAARRIV